MSKSTEEGMCSIYKSKRKIINGTEVEQDAVEVRGKTLRECKEIFNGVRNT